ncbi:hypothetical protein MJ3_12165 [Salimicrobium jeotgali]|uniref:Uncharacterized protein n=2 Tax=Salimicrobium jeotgali TaxID=1230341 RepID=K2FI41_9BACI|nr:hypothetical protein [Salimicrobium jeotgali]EKE30721.1 hypothetical protein MJ3_12165 [Salimicrobium jeotgali]MBM7697150.1 hypothetical protein [Salimicrobium jeotgali]
MTLSKPRVRYGIEDAIRPAQEVMSPERIGSFRITSLSFSRSILRRMKKENWKVEQSRFNLNGDGHGEAVYHIETSHGTFSFIAVSQDLEEHERSDRVISEKWDITFALCEGELSEEKIEHLKQELPKQEAGRGTVQDLVWSRANRSSRIFDYILKALTKERQPDPDSLAEVGYILRTTAFYGNGKFGLAPFEKMMEDHPFEGAFRAQMFAAFMLRQFSFDMVEHMARSRNPDAPPLDSRLKRYLGIGNATGLGMVPFLIFHPKLIHQWVYLRELALARSKVEEITLMKVDSLLEWLRPAIDYFTHYPVKETGIFESGDTIAEELRTIERELVLLKEELPFREGRQWVPFIESLLPGLSAETQEVLNSLMIEIYPEKNEELENYTVVSEEMELDPAMKIGQLLALIKYQYEWCFQYDFAKRDEKHFFWYRSIEKEEPRIAVRGEEPGDEHEMRMNIAELVQKVTVLLEEWNREDKVAKFIFRYPEFKGVIRRVQSLENHDYAEIHGNLLQKDMIPIYLMRCKLSFFGGERFDPKSNRWVRITLFQGAPLVEDVENDEPVEWMFPKLPALEEEA